MRLVTLVRLIIIRTLKEEKFLSALSIVGVMLGVALFVGVNIASNRATDYFAADIEGLSPAYTHEITAVSGADFDETILEPLLFSDLGGFFPVITTTATDNASRNLRILGLDTLRAEELSRLGTADEASFDLSFYTEPNSVILPRPYAERAGLAPGDPLAVIAYDRTFTLTVRGIYTPDDDAYGTTAVMDIGGFQEAFGTYGLLSRIDVIADDANIPRIANLLPDTVIIQSKSRAAADRERLIKSFRTNLHFISLLSILVGVFLLYNTVFVAVVKRRSDIGILRALGATKRTVTAVFTLYGLILGVVGSLLGIVIGQVFAIVSVIAVSETLSVMYGGITITDTALTLPDALTALVLGVAVSLVSSILPAMEAAKVRPFESMREGSFEGRYERSFLPLLLFGVPLVILGIVMAVFDYATPESPTPYLAYAGTILIIAGATLASPMVLKTSLGILKGPVSRIFPATGTIAVGDMRGTVFRFAVALMSLAISTALVVAMVTLIISFRTSLKDWIDANIEADIYISPAACTSNFCPFPMDNEIVDILRTTPNVIRINRFRTIKVLVNGRPVLAGFADSHDLNARFSVEPDYLPPTGTVGRVFLSEYFRLKYDIEAGDTVSIMTPKEGERRFFVERTFPSYSTTDGFLLMYYDDYTRFWNRNDVTQVSAVVAPGADVDAVIEEFNANLPEGYALTVQNNDALRREIITVFDRSFAITYAIELIAIVVSIIGVVNTLLSLVFERKREISVLRYLGASWEQLKGVLLVSASLVGVVGVSLGVVLGLGLSVIFIRVINTISFGWVIYYRIPVGWLVFFTGLLFVSSVVAGLLPAIVARRIDARRYISFE